MAPHHTPYNCVPGYRMAALAPDDRVMVYRFQNGVTRVTALWNRVG
jgi:hypothetical protein